MERIHATSVSNRQFVLLREAKKSGISIPRAAELSQITLGSCVRRRFIEWDEKLDAFVLGVKGLAVLEHYTDFDINRGNTEGAFSKEIRKRWGTFARARKELAAAA